MDQAVKLKLIAMHKEAIRLLENTEAVGDAVGWRVPDSTEALIKRLVSLARSGDWVRPADIASAFGTSAADVGRALKPWEGVPVEVDGLGLVTIRRKRNSNTKCWEYQAEVE